jgi:hypothetical protein
VRCQGAGVHAKVVRRLAGVPHVWHTRHPTRR